MRTMRKHTFPSADRLEVLAAALVVDAHGVTLASPLRIEDSAARLTGLCGKALLSAYNIQRGSGASLPEKPFLVGSITLFLLHFLRHLHICCFRACE